MPRSNTLPALIGHSVFALLAIMAAWFWQERTLILDAAFQSYHFISDARPAIMVERFGAVSVQLLPLLAVRAGASLSTVLMLYSVSIALFHWCVFGICLHVLKDWKSALAVLLFNVLLVGDSFYWMQNELLQAVSLMFLLWSIWLKRSDWSHFNVRDWLLSLLLASAVAYYHPLVFFPLAFCWCFFWLISNASAGHVTRRTLLGIAGLFALIFSSKYIFRQPNFYDRGMTGQYVREFSFSPEKLLHAQSLHDLAAHLSGNFLLLLPLTVSILAYYILQKNFWKAALVLSFSAGYCLLILQRFLHDDRWYIQESHYQALAVFLIVPLIWDILPSLNLPRRYKNTQGVSWLAACLFILLAIRITGIWNTHRIYSDRLTYVRRLVAKTKNFEGRKFVIGESQADRKKLLMYWGLPFESLQISAIESPDSVRTLVIGQNPDSLAQRLSADSMPAFLMIPGNAFRDLPRNYYRMPDTAAYRALHFRQ